MKSIKWKFHVLLIVLMVSCNKNDDSIGHPPRPDSQNKAPMVFALLTPETDEVNTIRTPTFTWEQATDPDGDIVTYDLYLDKEDEPLTKVVSSLDNTTFTFKENLDLDSEYHWKVMAKDEKGAVTESEIGSFTTNLPIVLLKEFNSGLEGPGTLIFAYNQGLLMNISERFGNTWQLDYNEASGKLSRTSRELNGESVTYSYEYNSFGKQKSIKLGRSGNKESWDLEYDGNQRLISVVYEIEEGISDDSQVTVTLTYADENSSKPIGLDLVTTHPNSPETYNVSAILEWDDENIISIEYEITENGETYLETAKYTYDNNINPYYILTKNQFGFDDFFTLNIRTGMESIDFGAFYWQSKNNIVKMERVQTSVKGGSLMSSDTYEHIYSEDFYPLAATRVYIGGMSAEEIRELDWSY